MLSAELLREQVAAVVTILSKTAIVEICKIIDSSFAEMYREVCLRHSELEVLRTKVHSLTGQGRTHTEWSNFGNNISPPRRSIAVQVSSGQEVAECSTSVGPLTQCQDVMEVIVKVEEGGEQGNRETPRVSPGQLESATEPHAGLDGASQLCVTSAQLYRHSSALLPAAFGLVKQEEGVPSGDSHGETTLPFTHTHLKHPENSASALTHTQEEPLDFGKLELKAEQEEEKVDQKFHAVPSCSSPFPAFSSPNLLLPLSSSTSSKPSSSSATLIPRTAEATMVTEMPTQASVSPRLLQCSSCPKSFWQKAALKRHELSHSDVRLFDCDVCGKSFKLRANLQQHKLLHSGSKPFACRYCGKCFSHPSNMKTHQRIHTGERPYLCSTCGQTFNQHTTLTRHQKRRHQGPHGENTAKQDPQSNNDKPFPCHYCEQCFTNMSDRKKHQRIHTGERPYQCSECGLTFTQISHLTRHQKRLHSKNIAN